MSAREENRGGKERREGERRRRTLVLEDELGALLMMAERAACTSGVFIVASREAKAFMLSCFSAWRKSCCLRRRVVWVRPRPFQMLAAPVLARD